jgi:hypothetical protein
VRVVQFERADAGVVVVAQRQRVAQRPGTGPVGGTRAGPQQAAIRHDQCAAGEMQGLVEVNLQQPHDVLFGQKSSGKIGCRGVGRV